MPMSPRPKQCCFQGLPAIHLVLRAERPDFEQQIEEVTQAALTRSVRAVSARLVSHDVIHPYGKPYERPTQWTIPHRPC